MMPLISWVRLKEKRAARTEIDGVKLGVSIVDRPDGTFAIVTTRDDPDQPCAEMSGLLIPNEFRQTLKGLL